MRKINATEIYLLLFFMILSSCASRVRPPYGIYMKEQREKERLVHTRGHRYNLFHNLAVRKEMPEQFDGVLLCFEAIPTKKISRNGTSDEELIAKYQIDLDRVFAGKNWNSQKKQTFQVLSRKKKNVLTHSIATLNGDRTFLYNYYDFELAHWDAGYHLYDSTMKALDRLKVLLAGQLQQKKYTHLVLMSTGWNNQQEKSIYHYTQWLNNVSQAAKDSNQAFNPLYVALTWPSFKRNHSKTKVEYSGIDYPVEQSYADELGITHINYLLWKVLTPLSDSYNTPLVLMGHSLGARLLTRAAHSVKYIDTSEAKNNNKIDCFLAFQPAYRLSRHWGKSRLGQDNLIYSFTDPWKKFVSTNSKYDAAMKAGSKMGLYMGHPRAIIKIQSNATSPFSINETDVEGKLLQPKENEKKMVMVNCDRIIGNHQDVMSKANATLVWQYISGLKK